MGFLTPKLALLSVFFIVGACVGSPQEDEPAVSGNYDDGNEEHRPGQPCLLCHGPDHFPVAPGEKRFTLAGTVYGFVDDGEDDGIAGVDVKITDSQGFVATVTTNRVGNFMVSSGGNGQRGGWLHTPKSLVFPIEVSISRGEDKQSMRTIIHQEGSCARCHGSKVDIDSVGRIFLYERQSQ